MGQKNILGKNIMTKGLDQAQNVCYSHLSYTGSTEKLMASRSTALPWQWQRLSSPSSKSKFFRPFSNCVSLTHLNINETMSFIVVISKCQWKSIAWVKQKIKKYILGLLLEIVQRMQSHFETGYQHSIYYYSNH